jgi:hypothetical protein
LLERPGGSSSGPTASHAAIAYFGPRTSDVRPQPSDCSCSAGILPAVRRVSRPPRIETAFGTRVLVAGDRLRWGDVRPERRHPAFATNQGPNSGVLCPSPSSEVHDPSVHCQASLQGVHKMLGCRVKRGFQRRLYDSSRPGGICKQGYTGQAIWAR